MKKVLFLGMLVMGLLTTAQAQQTTKSKEKVKTTFVISDLDCQSCVNKIEKNIAFEKGVTALKCDLKSKQVEVTYRADRTSDAKLKEAFKKIGMEAVAQEKKESTEKK
ncbi:MAG: heavy-metal-associated domain-containing protein [Phocaeicola sp.]